MTNDTFLLAKSCHESGELYRAEQLYREVLHGEPDAFKAYNNLGNVLELQGRFADAIETYQRGVAVAPDCFQLHYNLAHALHLSGQLGPALLCYMKALNIEPTSCDTHFNIGNLLFDQGRYNSACEAFRRAAECDASCRQAFSNLGAAQYEMRAYEPAMESYRKAIAIEPAAPTEHFNIGKCLAALHRYDEAIHAYQQSLLLEPNSSTTHAHLVMLFQSLGRDFETDAAFENWQRVLPDDPVAAHLRASHSNENVPDRADDRYIQTVFDDFASEFDKVLASLKYCGPRVLVEKLADQIASPDKSLDILDAGCGTGLCGPLLRPFARNLEGVDLSLAMLEKAKFRTVYDDLFQEELTLFLEQRPAHYDVIVAADTLIYFGSLERVFTAAARALRPRGLLLCSLESLRQPAGVDFHLNRHGRYSHALEYVSRSAQGAGLDIVELSEAILRHEAAQKVSCHIVTARLPS